jgi:deazaflavin-dependent oxidoreductase (nitroreductase family)
MLAAHESVDRGKVSYILGWSIREGDERKRDLSDQQQISSALGQGGIIDITTIGRTSGQPRRIEIVFFNISGRVYISGLPGRRAWIANLQADPAFTFHLKKDVRADLPATARIITDAVERRPVIEQVCATWNRQDQVDAFFKGAPLIEVTFEDETLLAA